MDTKRLLILLLCFGFIVSNGFSQSKLQGAGKASKVGATTTTQKKATTNTKPSTAKKSETTKPKAKNNDSEGDKYASKAYMDILGISFANADADNTIIDNYDNKLYAKEVKYLTPRISYKGLASREKDVTLYIKLFDEDGKLKTGTGSPDGFTYSKEVKVENGIGKYIKLPGWGNPKGGSYNAGLYKMEIWYKDNMLYQKEIRLYSGTTPIVSSNIFSVSSISFANTDKDGKIISDYGQPLLDGKVQYLKPKIYYNGKYSNNQEVTLYVRYFKSSGELVSGSSSPVGFSFKENATIKPGTNSVILSGFGNEAATNYKEGSCKVEIWMDGEKLYETNVSITKSGSSVSSGSVSSGGSSSINDFFPIWGVTLGKTTWKQAEDVGNVVKIWKDGPDRYMDIGSGNITFWDHKGEGKFTSIYWINTNGDFPSQWKSKGFSWENSYNTWLSTLRGLGFTIKVTKEPETKYYDNRNTLSANVQALSKDGLLRFDLDFDYGEDGHYTSSPKSLYSITVRYLGN